jgi:multiple sugar transport system substrate-binding protein
MKKGMVLTVSVLMIALAFTGCQKKGGGQAAEGASAGPGGTLTIWSWGADMEKTQREEAVKLLQKAHPELKIEHVVLPTADSMWDQKSTAAFAAGNAGDVMQMSPDYFGLMTRYYEDLNPYVNRDGIDLEAVITEGMLDGYYRPDGKLEAMPLLANCFVYAYNKDGFI